MWVKFMGYEYFQLIKVQWAWKVISSIPHQKQLLNTMSSQGWKIASALKSMLHENYLSTGFWALSWQYPLKFLRTNNTLRV